MQKSYYTDGINVFNRNARNVSGVIPPRFVCTATSRTLAKRIANALNIYIPKRRRKERTHELASGHQ